MLRIEEMTMRTVDPHDAIEFIFKHGRKYAQARADRTYLEEFRKSQRALLMKDAEVEGHKTSAAQEREAYAHPTYMELLRGLREAVAVEEELRWGLVAAQARIDVWRSQEASARQEIKAVL
jgi:hypothetical protein